VGGEDDARAVLDDDLHHILKELTSREGVEACDRLVEHEQLRSLGDGEGECKLGALTAGELASLLSRVEPKALDAALGELRVPARVRPPAESEVIGDRESGIGRGVLGDKADTGELARRRARAATEDGDRPRARPQEADRDLEQRSLAGAVRADEPNDLAGGDDKAALRERPLAAVALTEAVRL
jgi:hypothetical protein